MRLSSKGALLPVTTIQLQRSLHLEFKLPLVSKQMHQVTNFVMDDIFSM